jgi:predicted small lipoprotein YifL
MYMLFRRMPRSAHELYLIYTEDCYMKKKLVAYLLVSALAVTALIGCGKKGGDADAANAAATTEAAAPVEGAVEDGAEAEAEAVENAVEEAVVEEVTSDATTAAAIEAVEAATAAEAVAAEAGTGEAAAEEFVDDEAAAAVTGEAAAANTEEDVIVDPGTQYTVRFGGNIYASMDQNDANVIDYVYPGYILNINERLDNYWYHVTYWIDGAARSGYIKIQ